MEETTRSSAMPFQECKTRGCYNWVLSPGYVTVAKGERRKVSPRMVPFRRKYVRRMYCSECRRELGL